ncbi:MAG: diaminopimelate epimerase [Bacteroidetes bacterium]|nr:MAG: diaminopimelate epimerase [Bacteroidota bacterium]
MKLSVTYMSGAGNLFSVIDNRKYRLNHARLVELSHIICQTKTFKTEGLLVLSNLENYAFKVDFYNPDGSFGVMCGNGARCAVVFSNKNNIFDIKYFQNEIPFFMCGRDYIGKYNDRNIIIYFPPPIKIQSQISLKLENETQGEIEGTYIDVGSQHFIVNLKKQAQWINVTIENFDLMNIAPNYRYHKLFAPKGVNFNIYDEIDKKTILLRTYERGVEGETGACGTGAISTVISSVMNNETEFPVTVIPTSKIPVIVDIVGTIDSIEQITLEGPAEFIGSDEIEIPD